MIIRIKSKKVSINLGKVSSINYFLYLYNSNNFFRQLSLNVIFKVDNIKLIFSSRGNSKDYGVDILYNNSNITINSFWSNSSEYRLHFESIIYTPLYNRSFLYDYK